MLTCRSCKTANNDGDRFCINCGRGLETVAESVPDTAGATPSAIGTRTSTGSRAKLSLGLVGSAILGLTAGTLLTANDVMEPLIGVRYTKREMTAAKKSSDDAGYKRGFSAGESSGYERGYDNGTSAGYSTGYDIGKRDGCNEVFDLVADNIIAIYYPYNRFSVGSTYYSRSLTC